jgi:septal ring factor EnvC (AmiA/AmiB activator)
MTEFKMPPRDRSPGLMPSPRTEEPEYPTTITSLIVQIAALRGCVEKLEAERDAAVARTEKAEADPLEAIEAWREQGERAEKAEADLVAAKHDTAETLAALIRAEAEVKKVNLALYSACELKRRAEEQRDRARDELAQVKTLVRRVFDSGDTQDLLCRAALADESTKGAP